MATRDEDLTSNSLLEVEWFDNNGSPITGETSGVSVMGVSSTNDLSLTSTLMFTSIMTGQAGLYTCSVNLTIPGADVMDHNVRRVSAVRVMSKSVCVCVVIDNLCLSPSPPSTHCGSEC